MLAKGTLPRLKIFPLCDCRSCRQHFLHLKVSYARTSVQSSLLLLSVYSSFSFPCFLLLFLLPLYRLLVAYRKLDQHPALWGLLSLVSRGHCPCSFYFAFAFDSWSFPLQTVEEWRYAVGWSIYYYLCSSPTGRRTKAACHVTIPLSSIAQR